MARSWIQELAVGRRQIFPTTNRKTTNTFGSPTTRTGINIAVAALATATTIFLSSSSTTTTTTSLPTSIGSYYSPSAATTNNFHHGVFVSAFSPPAVLNNHPLCHHRPLHTLGFSNIDSSSSKTTTTTTTTSRREMSSSSSSSSSVTFPYITSAEHVPDLPPWMLKERTRVLRKGVVPGGCNRNSSNGVILYWMQRDVRTQDNWALLLAQHYAQVHELPLHVVYALPPPPSSSSALPSSSILDPPPQLSELPMTERYGKFLLDGLQCVHEDLKAQEVPFHVVKPTNSEPTEVIKSVFDPLRDADARPAMIITDMSPIRHVRQWTESLPAIIDDDDEENCPVYQVDAHNVVPVWYASPKREVGARTLRPKIHKLIDDCLQYQDYKKENFIPNFEGNKHLQLSSSLTCPDFDYENYKKFLQWDDKVEAVDGWAKGGTKAGMEQFEQFVKVGLPKFGQLRNDPNEASICSHLSPWLNLGHISFATLMRRLKTHNRDSEGKASFIEEGLVRRELSDNFLWYTPDDYDKLTGAAGWAQESLELHINDAREHTYTLEQFVNGQTHDDLWNASQIQLTTTGKLHGFLRMYWCKKILEWTTSPTEALRIGQHLNDYYALDGRDPNGFVGIGWSIMGIHDMGWKERDIFGKIRFMNYAGCKRKFKVDEFVAKYPPAYQNALDAGGTPATSSKRKSPSSSTKANGAKKAKK